MEFGEFKNIDFDVPSCGITVKAGEKFNLDYQLSAAYEITNISIQEGTFHFHCKHRYPSALFHWNGRSNYICVTLPTEVWLEQVNIRDMSGPVELIGIRAASLAVKTVSGNITASNLVIKEGKVEEASGRLTIENSMFDQLIQHGASGNFQGNSLTTSVLSSELLSGQIRLNGRFSGETHLRTVSGNIEVNTELPLSEYGCQLKTVSGTYRINGHSVDRVENPSAVNNITAQTTSGSIRLNFAG